MNLNLLPWRENFYANQQKNRLIFTSAGVLFAILIIIFARTFLSDSIKNIQQKIQVREAQLKEIKARSEKSSEAEMQVTSLQNILFDKKKTLSEINRITKAANQKVYFTAFSRQGNVFKMTGIAESLADFSAFNEYFPEMMFDEIKEMKDSKEIQFDVKVDA